MRILHSLLKRQYKISNMKNERSRVVVDFTLRRRGGGEIGASWSILRLVGFEEPPILRKLLLNNVSNA